MTRRKPDQLDGYERAEYQRIQAARDECERFIYRAKALQGAILDTEENTRWGRRDRADVMRASMDVSRAMSALRKRRT